LDSDPSLREVFWEQNILYLSTRLRDEFTFRSACLILS
jgi:hypothetical protein